MPPVQSIKIPRSSKLETFFKNKLIFLLFFLFSLALAFVVFYANIGTKNNHIIFHDSLYYDYPLRFVISNAYKNGIYPLWDQWTFSGMPFALESEFVNISPVVWLFSFFGNYSVGKFLMELFFMQLVGFLGMFFWLRTYVGKWISLYFFLYCTAHCFLFLN